ncbi:oligosaccharide flippase family protein [Siminovitchia sp. FSL W7-1587]|uniref:lipopolysaccharide biosynthesis protein n=1 Tax=Siminovitchia sp. FSL W7-1587 TaxID=2954699 RepID=UPI0030CF62F6
MSKGNGIKSSLFGSAGIYMITQVLNASIPFLLLPVITRYLSPEEFGIYSMFKVVSGLVFSIIGIGINGAITRVYYDKNKGELARYIANSFLLVTINSILMYLVFGLFTDFISDKTYIPNNWLWTVILVSYGKVIFQATLVIWQVENKPFTYGAFQILQTTLNFTLNLWFIISLNLNWTGAILAETIAFFGFGILGFFFLLKNKWLKFKISIQDIKHIISYGSPLIPHVVGMYVITASDRFLITALVGISETGLYTVGYQIGMIIMILQDSFNKAWVPWLFSKLKQNNDFLKIKIVKFTYIYFVIIILAALILYALSPIILQIMAGPAYQNASQFILWLGLGYAFNGMYKMVTNYIFFDGRTYYLATITFITAVINILISYALIKLNGPIGAAQGTAISYLISFFLTWYFSNVVYKMPWFNLRQKSN